MAGFDLDTLIARLEDVRRETGGNRPVVVFLSQMPLDSRDHLVLDFGAWQGEDGVIYLTNSELSIRPRYRHLPAFSADMAHGFVEALANLREETHSPTVDCPCGSPEFHA